MKVWIAFLLMFSTSAYSHNQPIEKLISNDGYIWFHEKYEFKPKTITVTNANGDVRVANIEKPLNLTTEVVSLEGDSIAVTWSKEVLQNYLVLSLEPQDIVRVFNELGENESFEVVFNGLFEQKLEESFCDKCVKKLTMASYPADSPPRLLLTDIPKHYFINGQVFLISSTVFPSIITINNRVKANTKLKVTEQNAGTKVIEIFPASLRSQPIFLMSRPLSDNSGQSGGGSADVKVRKTQSYPDRQGP